MILHIPHSSRIIPAAFRDQFILNDEELDTELLRLTDAFTDELFDMPEAEKIVSPCSRLAVDVERFADDAEEPMSRVGMGRFYTMTTDGRPLRQPLTPAELVELDQLYTAHHQKLTDAVEEELERHSQCLIVDCHSFPSIPLPCDRDQTQPRPDFCLGTDSYHTPETLTRKVVAYLEQIGFSVEVNRPYSGTMVPLEHYKKDSRVKSIMIEINRKLYMDETTGEKTPGFDEIRQTTAELLSLIKGI